MSLYGVLGLEASCSSKQITCAYRQLQLKLHPDRNRGSEDSVEDERQRVREAYDVLSDEMKRNEYDAKNNLNISRRIEAASKLTLDKDVDLGERMVENEDSDDSDDDGGDEYVPSMTVVPPAASSAPAAVVDTQRLVLKRPTLDTQWGLGLNKCLTVVRRTGIGECVPDGATVREVDGKSLSTLREFVDAVSGKLEVEISFVSD